MKIYNSDIDRAFNRVNYYDSASSYFHNRDAKEKEQSPEYKHFKKRRAYWRRKLTKLIEGRAAQNKQRAKKK